ncbi:hypothetical protein QTP88_004076 [Uroleucon formosanum]
MIRNTWKVAKVRFDCPKVTVVNGQRTFIHPTCARRKRTLAVICPPPPPSFPVSPSSFDCRGTPEHRTRALGERASQMALDDTPRNGDRNRVLGRAGSPLPPQLTTERSHVQETVCLCARTRGNPLVDDVDQM